MCVLNMNILKSVEELIYISETVQGSLMLQKITIDLGMIERS